MVQQTKRFCAVLSTCSHRGTFIHTFPKGIHFQEWGNERETYPQTYQKYLWTKTSQKELEQIFSYQHGQIRFKPSKIDPCLYYWDKMVILIYINDCIMFSPEKSALNQVIKVMCHLPRKFRIEALGDIKDFFWDFRCTVGMMAPSHSPSPS